MTGYYTFEKGTDLNLGFQSSLWEATFFYERVHGDERLAYGVVCTEPGAPARGTGVLISETTPSIYRQNDEGKGGYNPNEEHAFVTLGSGGYVTWALRTDLNEDDAPRAAVFVEYGFGGKGRMQMFDVVLTNETWATLTSAADGLAEVWNAKSMAVIYPNPDVVEKTVLLTDPTVVQSVKYEYSNLAKLGLSTDKNGGLAQKKGKIYFTDLPPHLSSRLYVDSTNNKLCFMGEKKTSAAGASILYPNVLSVAERELVKGLPRSGGTSDVAAWEAAVDALAVAAVRPSTNDVVRGEIFTDYKPVDHYALVAMGATNYVTLVENDATNSAMNVSSGDPINMHILKVVPEYYTGRIVTREDEVNLLSQQLSVLYSESFLGEADQYEFEWRKASPNSNGTVPTDYENGYEVKANGAGLVRLVIGAQGDTLANMVNTYWICRYRAKDEKTPAWAKELTKYWVDDITSDPEFVRYCQPFQSQFGTLEKEPGLIIPFSTTIDFAKNLFGNDLAGGDSAYDSTWYATRIAAADSFSICQMALEDGIEGYVALRIPISPGRAYAVLHSPNLKDGSWARASFTADSSTNSSSAYLITNTSKFGYCTIFVKKDGSQHFYKVTVE